MMKKSNKEETLVDLPKTVQQLAPWLEKQLLGIKRRLKRLESQQFTDLASLLCRGQLLAGNGERLEQAIMPLIREYRRLKTDFSRLLQHPDLSSDFQRDLETTLGVILADREGDLELLGVTLIEVEPGTTLDFQVHQVEERLGTSNPELLNTVHECLVPGFRWRGNQTERREPAHVAAYVELDPSESADEKENELSRPTPTA